ncbi:hypothetical protein D3C78_943860 [compost metagenome]
MVTDKKRVIGRDRSFVEDCEWRFKVRRAGAHQGQWALLWVLHQRPWAGGEGHLFSAFVSLGQVRQRRSCHRQGKGIAQNTSTAKVVAT